ncbi:MAG TPA: cobalamin-dependent protein [Candidatus Sulfotelmatobacter sp.]|nr:cobalamin-dependent protein [Candidatus Sulfotelmatobacter sp.]
MVVASTSAGARRRAQPGPLRLLTAVPICDGHDSAVITINLELARHGVEVVYLGYHCAASAIARAAVQEDVHAIGLSSYNGGHRVFFREVLAQLRARGAGDIPVFGGGGGTITPADRRAMARDGVDRIFFPGTPLADIIEEVTGRYPRELTANARLRGDRALGRAITLSEAGARGPAAARRAGAGGKAFVVGVAGPGGAGKSTLIDELTSRFLRRRADGRVAILANDPSHPGSGGAVLGDRVSAIYSQDNRVFFRSMATRGSLTGLSAAAPAAIASLRAGGEFDLVFVESVGIGQDGDPFGAFGRGPRLADAVLFVLAPHYGGRIQLQKIAMLNGADLVALNKCDDPMAHTARAEVVARLASNGRDQLLHATVAARHHDAGVDQLYTAIAQLAGLEPVVSLAR